MGGHLAAEPIVASKTIGFSKKEAFFAVSGRRSEKGLLD